MNKSISRLGDYKNPAIVHRFIETWDMPLSEAEELFEETKKWLWLCAYQQQNADGSVPPLAISQSTKLIDEMWHTFILFTKDYHEFCDTHFGIYVHHRPTPRSEYDEVIARYEDDADAVLAENRDRFAKQYELIYELLGEATLVKWYDTYLERYTDERLQQIWRWSFSPYDNRVKDQVRLERVPAKA